MTEAREENLPQELLEKIEKLGPPPVSWDEEGE